MFVDRQKLRRQLLVTNHSSRDIHIKCRRNSGCLFGALLCFSWAREIRATVVRLIPFRGACNFLVRLHIVWPASDIQADAEQRSESPHNLWKDCRVTVHLILLNQKGVGFS